MSQKIYTRANLGTTFHNVEYDAYLKFENGEKVFLSNKKDKKELLEKLKKLAVFFELEISDNTL